MTERIGYSPYFYSYPQYLSNNFGVNNKITPNFRSNSVGVATHQPTVNYTTPPDTVEISAGNKINEASTQEKQKTGMSTGAKIGLGILGTAATVYGCVVGHRMINKPSIEKVAKNFSEIFRREVSKDEAQKMVNNYKELLEIKDTEEFCKKAFEQVKKDYGYEDLNIPLMFKPQKTWKDSASWNSEEGILTLHIKDSFGKDIGTWGRKDIIKSLLHEFQHAKQTEYAYRTSPEKYLQAHKDNLPLAKIARIFMQPKEIQLKFAKSLNMSLSEFHAFLKTCAKEKDFDSNLFKNNLKVKDIKAIEKLFGKSTPFEIGSKEYNQGLEYIKGTANYINPKIDDKLYRSQLLEKEAYATGDKFKEIYNYFANPWRIF